MISLKDIGWVAGFIEGEGSFYSHRNTPVMSATQVQFEPIERMYRLLGGSINTFSRKEVRGNVYFRWNASGGRAAGIMMTIFPFMSPKRKTRIKEVLFRWSHSVYKGNYNHRKKFCIHGHEFTPENTYIKTNGGRECKTCSSLYKKNWYQINGYRLPCSDKARGLVN